MRSLIKDRIKRTLGAGPATPYPQAAAPPAPTPRAAEPTPVPQVAVAPTPAPAPARAPSSEPTAVDPAKIERHWNRARKGVLKLVADKGGRANLGEMHDHSERRYFIGHKKFSDMMESFVAEGLVSYDAATQDVTLTDKGRELVAT